MPTPQELNATGTTLRIAFETLASRFRDTNNAPYLDFVFAALSNHLLSLERADGVPAGFYGSQGAPVLEINPGTLLPLPIRLGEPPPPAPLTLPTPPPDAEQPPGDF